MKFIKINKLVFTLLFSVFMTVSCNDEFLDGPQPTAEVPDVVVFDSRESVEALLSGIHRRFRGQYTNADSANIHSIYFARSVKGNDLIQGIWWFNFDYDNNNREPGFRRTIFNWNYPYYMINQANVLIKGVEASSLSDIDKKQLIAKGKTIRAFFYFQLAMEFQHTYSFDKTLLAPPIYTGEISEGNPMSTLEEMYTLIVADLTEAITDLDNTRLGKSYINDQVANGILARVYLVMENWAGAETAAKLAYAGEVEAVLDPDNYDDGFINISNKEWIWGSPNTADQSAYFHTYPHSSIAFKRNHTYINSDFVNEFTSTDVRNLFEKNTKLEEDNYKYIRVHKFIFEFDSDISLMRTAEMILIEAEAKHRQGDATAHDLLFSLQSNRDPMAVKSSNTGNALLDEILLERRKELYAEIGVEWFDAKRTRKALPRTGNHRLSKPKSTLEADDKHFFLKIPQAEIDANDNIDESINADRDR